MVTEKQTSPQTSRESLDNLLKKAGLPPANPALYEDAESVGSGENPDTPPQQPDAIAQELADLRTATVPMRADEFIDSMNLAEEIGKIKASQAVSSMLSLGAVRALAAVRDSKAYKSILMAGKNGIFKTDKFDDFCEGMGLARSTVYENLQNYDAFGEKAFEEVRELGLSRTNTRAIRKVIKDQPEDTKKAIMRELKNTAPEDMRTTIDVLCAQYGKAQADIKKLEKEKARLEGKVEGLEADIKTKDDLAKARNQQLDEAKEALERATSPYPADAAKRRDQVNVNARKEIDKVCQDAVHACMQIASQALAIFNHPEVEDDTCAYVHQAVSQAVDGMALTILNAGIDVDLKASFLVDYGPKEPWAEPPLTNTDSEEE